MEVSTTAVMAFVPLSEGDVPFCLHVAKGHCAWAEPLAMSCGSIGDKVLHKATVVVLVGLVVYRVEDIRSILFSPKTFN